MSGLVRNMVRGVRRLWSPRPSFFDLLLAGLLAAPFLPHGTKQETFFIFYILSLWSVSFMLKAQRSFKSTSLALLTLWCLIGVFIHSFYVSETSITRQYLNMYLMSEGFIYILASCTFLMLALTFSRNLRFAWLLLPLAFYPFIKDYVSGGRISVVASLIVATIAYLALKKKWGLFLWITILSSGVMVVFWQWITFKFFCRPAIWGALLSDVVQHPFIGSGFPKNLVYDNMHFLSNYKGVMIGNIYNHNDYLTFASYVGLPGILFVLVFILSIFKKIQTSIMFIPTLAITLLCFFQMTMFDIGKASIILVMIALIILSTYKQEEVCAR